MSRITSITVLERFEFTVGLQPAYEDRFKNLDPIPFYVRTSWREINTKICSECINLGETKHKVTYRRNIWNAGFGPIRFQESDRKVQPGSSKRGVEQVCMDSMSSRSKLDRIRVRYLVNAVWWYNFFIRMHWSFWNRDVVVNEVERSLRYILYPISFQLALSFMEKSDSLVAQWFWNSAMKVACWRRQCRNTNWNVERLVGTIRAIWCYIQNLSLSDKAALREFVRPRISYISGTPTFLYIYIFRFWHSFSVGLKSLNTLDNFRGRLYEARISYSPDSEIMQPS